MPALPGQLLLGVLLLAVVVVLAGRPVAGDDEGGPAVAERVDVVADVATLPVVAAVSLVLVAVGGVLLLVPGPVPVPARIRGHRRAPPRA